jgi:hypothetical protein
MTAAIKVKTERNLDPEKDLTEDSYVLGSRRNKSRIVLPVMKKEVTRHDLSETRQGNR